ncbi:hypothetical protein IFO70_28020 [Phormidium tenue FACHB-886]|nr:hypothetical protein [Phormidium tenue FACHB-886]
MEIFLELIRFSSTEAIMMASARMYYLPDRKITAVVVENGDIAQRRNNGNLAAPIFLIDALIEQVVQRTAT